MKLSYENINYNLVAYEKALAEYPILSQYIEGSVSFAAANAVGMAEFAQFHQFLKKHSLYGFSPISDKSMAIFQNLKKAIADSTTTPRFKTFVMNRTKKKFDEMLSRPEEFDRLLNGAWKSRPAMLRSGRMSAGTRKRERVEGLEKAIVPLINYAILNGIEIDDRIASQSAIAADIEWFFRKRLSFSGIRTKEMSMTSSLIKSFSELLEKENVDIRTLNVKYIMSAIEKKISGAFAVKEGTALRCVESHQWLAEGKTYVAQGSYESNGSLLVSVRDDEGRNRYYPFSAFEDISTRRDDLLRSLLG